MKRLWTAVRYAGTLARLGPALPARVKIFLAVLYLVARSRLGFAPGPVIRLSFACDGDSIALAVDRISDLHAVDEVLLRGQYALGPEVRPATIVDLGSHIGISAAFFCRRYPDARILAVEPNPESFRKLELNVEELPGVTARRVAVGKRRGRAVMHAGSTPLRASLREDAGVGFDVESTTLDDLVREHGIDRIDLLKIDVEGAELEVLSEFEGLDGVGAIVGELHPQLIGAPTDEFLSLLDGFDVALEPAGEDLQFTAVRGRA